MLSPSSHLKAEVAPRCEITFKLRKFLEPVRTPVGLLTQVFSAVVWRLTTDIKGIPSKLPQDGGRRGTQILTHQPGFDPDPGGRQCPLALLGAALGQVGLFASKCCGSCLLDACCFSNSELFLVTLTVLRSTGQIFCRMFLSLDLLMFFS